MMRAKPVIQDPETGTLTPCEPSEATHVWLRFPSPIEYHLIPIRGKANTLSDTWEWNQDTENPTLKPSILARTGEHTCHTYLTEGKVKFLNDCTHENAGKTMEALDVSDV